MLFSLVGAMPVTFTYPVAAAVTSGNKKPLLDVCDSDIFQEVFSMFGFYKTQHYNNTFNFQSVFFKK
jgi:hypothetical protein